MIIYMYIYICIDIYIYHTSELLHCMKCEVENSNAKQNLHAYVCMHVQCDEDLYDALHQSSFFAN